MLIFTSFADIAGNWVGVALLTESGAWVGVGLEAALQPVKRIASNAKMVNNLIIILFLLLDLI
jgi:hypothetical protein